jgi:hypothetical protein
MWSRRWIWSARTWAWCWGVTAVAMSTNALRHDNCPCRIRTPNTLHTPPHGPAVWSYRQVHAAVVDLYSNSKRLFTRYSHRITGVSRREGISPLSLYSMGSLICRGVAPDTAVLLNPFSGALRWASSTGSGTPARRKGLRIGIVIRH